jgi:hypothetical protein
MNNVTIIAPIRTYPIVTDLPAYQQTKWGAAYCPVSSIRISPLGVLEVAVMHQEGAPMSSAKLKSQFTSAKITNIQSAKGSPSANWSLYDRVPPGMMSRTQIRRIQE